MKLTLTTIKPESPDVKSFIFKPSKPLIWKAGQYLHYMLHHEPTDDRGSDRWFTIASAPFEHHVMITTRLAKTKGSTFKKNLKDLKVGEAIEVSDVDGDFIVTKKNKDYVFIAGGIGITPFRSILKEMQHAGIRLRVTLNLRQSQCKYCVPERIGNPPETQSQFSDSLPHASRTYQQRYNQKSRAESEKTSFLCLGGRTNGGKCRENVDGNRRAEKEHQARLVPRLSRRIGFLNSRKMDCGKFLFWH